MRAVRPIFIAAALFNLFVGAAMMAAPAWVGELAGSPYHPAALLTVRTAGLLIAVFGIGYAFVAADPLRNRDLIRLGIIGKSSFIAFVAVACVDGALPWRALLSVLADIVFVALFLISLRLVDSQPN